MPDNMLMHRAGAVGNETTEKAERAVKAFRSLQPTLTAYARALTGRPEVRVDMAARDNGSTDGTRIFFRPPLALGDNTPHVRRDCDKRDSGGLMKCAACRVREEVLVTIYHEIAHICYQSFATVSEGDRSRAILFAIKEAGGEWADVIRERIKNAPTWKTRDYVNLTSLVNEYLPYLFNCLEDARVNTSLFEYRAGTRAMFQADAERVFRDGFEMVNDEGETVVASWHEAPLNSQAMVGCFVKACGFDYSTWFHPRVVEALNDDALTRLVEQTPNLKSASAVYNLAFKVLARLRDLGFCGTAKDPDYEEPEDEPDADEPDDTEVGTPDPDPVPDDAEPDGSDEGGDSPTPAEEAGSPGDGETEQDDAVDPAEEAPPAGGSEGEDEVDGQGEGGSDAEGSAGEAGQEPDDGDGLDPEQGSREGGSDAGREADPSGEAEAGEADPGSDGADADGGDEPESGGGGQPSGGCKDGNGESGDAAADPEPGGSGGDEADSESLGSGDDGTEAPADGPGRGAPAESDPSGDEGDDPEPGDGSDRSSDGGSDDRPEPGGGGRDAGEVDGGDGDAQDASRDGGGSGTEDGPEEGADPQPSDEAGGDDSDRDAGPDDGSASAESGGAESGGMGAPDSDGQPEGVEDSDRPGDGDTAPGEERGLPERGSDAEPAGDADDARGEQSAEPAGPEVADLPAGDGPSPRDDAGTDLGTEEHAAPGSHEPEDADSDDRSSDEGQGSESGEPSASDGLHPDDVLDDDGLIDTGADDGYGGTSVEELDVPDFGTPDDVQVIAEEWFGHDKPTTMQTEGEADAVDRAIVQGIYFTRPSVNVFGVREHHYGTRTIIDNVDYTLGWNAGGRVPAKIEVPEVILQPALGKMRAAFTENARGRKETNLRSGKINTKALGKRAGVGDSRVFRKDRLPGRREYHVVIGMDISGSTQGKNLRLEKRAVMAQAELLHRLGIGFSIYAHTAYPHDHRAAEKRTHLGNDLDIYHIKGPDELWSSKVQERLAGLSHAAYNLDGHAMEYLRKRLDERPESDKILLYYSDGKMPAENHNEELMILTDEIAICRRKGYVLLGVGIRTNSPARHGLDTVQVDGDEDVVKVVQHLGKRIKK